MGQKLESECGNHIRLGSTRAVDGMSRLTSLAGSLPYWDGYRMVGAVILKCLSIVCRSRVKMLLTPS